MLAGVVPGDLIFVASHLHENSAAQIGDERLVVREPGNRADGLGSKPEADAHRTSGKRILGKAPRQLDRADHARAIVVGLHGVTGMRLHEEFTCLGIRSAFGMDDRRGDFESLLWVSDEFRFDDRMIFLIARKFIECILRQTKSPITFVVFEDPWNSMRTFLIEIQMRLEFFKSEESYQQARNTKRCEVDCP